MPFEAARKLNDYRLEAPHGALAFLFDLEPKVADFRSDVIAGLSQEPKSLSPKYLYDERGSQLFDAITRLDAYYPTRTERAIIDANAADIAAEIGSRRAVFEYGSGSSEKIRKLIDLMNAPQGYVAMDISRDHLIDSATALAATTSLPVGAVCADFTEPLDLPAGLLGDDVAWLGYFPGSTLGNLAEDDARAFLRHASETLGRNARFLLGIDLEKDEAVLRTAYDDPDGVTAQFNLNLLRRLRRELDAGIDLDAFEHHIEIRPGPQRVEMHLRARRATTIRLDDQVFHFGAGETLHTENSRKFTAEGLDALLADTPWRRQAMWADPKGWFAACLLGNN